MSGEGEMMLYGALTIIAVALFAYLALLQMRQRRIQQETARLTELVKGGRKAQ